MYKIGITGSIGAGKSTIAKIFSLLGIPVHDSDKEVKELLEQKIVISKIQKKWPDAICKNVINKKFLREKIFYNQKDKKFLEEILHPLVNKKKNEFEKENRGCNILVYDVPLIFETKTQNLYDLVILANCSDSVQKIRVLNRKILDENMFKKVKKNQLSFEEKLKYKPLVIDTMKPLVVTFLKIVFILLKIKFKKKNG